MNPVFVVERHGVRPEFRIGKLELAPGTRGGATLDLTILVRGKTVAQIFGAKLVDGRDGPFVTGPSFVGPDGQ